MDRTTGRTLATVITGVAIALIAASFLIGFWTDRGELPPDGEQTEPTGESAAADRSIEMHNTALHRLLVKTVPLHPGVAEGGAITRLDQTLYLFMNRNYENDERLTVIDLEGPERYRDIDLSVPMNLEELLSSPVMEVEGFDPGRFRVYGLYAEPAGDGVHRLYVTHSVYEPGRNCISFNLSRTDLAFDGGSVRQESDWQTLFTADPCIDPVLDRQEAGSFDGPVAGRFPGHMAGGGMVNYGDDQLLVSVGSFHRDGDSFENRVSDEESDVGKFLLVDKQTGESSVYARGVRNAQGLYRDTEGTVWATEHGPQGGDALLVVGKDRHYGWPYETLGLNYGNRPWPNARQQGRFERFTPPQFGWTPGIAPSSLIRISGDRFPLWEGDLLIGSLIDQGLHRLRIGEDNRVIYHERIELDRRLRGLATLPDGQIAILTDDGHLLILDNAGPVYERLDSTRVREREVLLNRFDRLSDDELVAGRLEMNPDAIFVQKCAACHNLGPVHGIGPHLNEIYGREVGESPDYNFSPVLAGSDRTWTPELMKEFLMRPREQFPGTRMPPISLTEAEADRVVEFLEDH